MINQEAEHASTPHGGIVQCCGPVTWRGSQHSVSPQQPTVTLAPCLILSNWIMSGPLRSGTSLQGQPWTLTVSHWATQSCSHWELTSIPSQNPMNIPGSLKRDTAQTGLHSLPAMLWANRIYTRWHGVGLTTTRCALEVKPVCWHSAIFLTKKKGSYKIGRRHLVVRPPVQV